ncbi:MAG: NUDIX hydrolase [Chloroflexia bacterium]
MKNDKPLAKKLGWHLKETTYPFGTKWLTIRQDRIEIEGNGEIEYAYRESRGAVVIVPITGDRHMVLIRQYRYTVDDWCLEVPAGGLYDREGAAPEEVAREELHEEAGATCDKLILVSEVYSNNSTTNELMYVYLATGVDLSDMPSHEMTEQIEVLVVPTAEAIEMARTGAMKDALSALAVLQCEPKLRELGLI